MPRALLRIKARTPTKLRLVGVLAYLIIGRNFCCKKHFSDEESLRRSWCARKALSSAELSLAGGQPAATRSAPANILSQEEDEYRRAHLRREGHSPEDSTSSYEGWLRRSRRTHDIRTSAEPSLAGGQHPVTRSAPANILSQEEDGYRRAQLR